MTADLTRLVRDVVLAHEEARPRSAQRILGPSGVGHPCDRNVAYQLLGYTPISSGGDKWPAYSGTAVHVALGNAFRLANQRARDEAQAAGQPDPGDTYLTDLKVTAWPGHGGRGELDLYVVPSATVVDFKYLGTSAMKEQRGKPKREYRVQAHVYGLGATRAGHPVKRVAIAMLPRAGSMSTEFLNGLHVWTEPYDEAIAIEAKARVDNLTQAFLGLDAAGIRNGNALALVAHATPGPHCAFCRFWKPGSTDLDEGCPGAPPPAARVDSLADLIAPPPATKAPTTQGAAA